MTAALQQLLYTWTPRGVEGVNRFQIARMSPGLRSGPAAATLPVVRKICRYDRPAGRSLEDPPVSFGWFDHRGARIAFHRTGLPPVRGKVGNFAVHVLVGSHEQLPEAAIARTFGSPSWWRGYSDADLAALAAGDRSFELPLTDLSEFEPGPTEPTQRWRDDQAVVLAHALMTLPPDARLRVTGFGALGSLVRKVAEVLPEAIEGLSFSTYEGRPTFPFSVVGSDTPSGSRQRVCVLDPPQPLDAADGATVRRLLTTDSAGASLRRAARHARPAQAEARRAAVWGRAAELVALLEAPQDEGSGAFDPTLLSEPATLAFVATEASGRRSIARSVHSGVAGVRTAMQQAAPAMTADQRSRLADAIIERYTVTRVAKGCARTAESMPEAGMAERLLDTVLALCVDDADAATSLNSEDVVAVLGYASRRRLPPERVRRLLLDCASSVGHCSADPAVRDSYVQAMAQHVLSTDAPPDPAVYALIARPRLASGVNLDPAARRRAVALLGRVRGRQLEWSLLVLLPHLLDADSLPDLANVLQQVSPTYAATAILSGTHDRQDDRPDIDEVVEQQAARLLHEAVLTVGESSAAAVRLAGDLLTSSRSADALLAARLLRAADLGDCHTALEAATDAHGLSHRKLREELQAFALTAAVEAVRQHANVAAVWNWMQRNTPHETPEALLRALLSYGAGQPGGRPTAIMLSWIARSLIPTAPKLVDSRAHLRDEVLDDLAKAIVVKIPRYLIEEQEPYIEVADRRSKAWWRGLEQHYRSAHARPVSRGRSKRRLG